MQLQKCLFHPFIVFPKIGAQHSCFLYPVILVEMELTHKSFKHGPCVLLGCGEFHPTTDTETQYGADFHEEAKWTH